MGKRDFLCPEVKDGSDWDAKLGVRTLAAIWSITWLCPQSSLLGEMLDLLRFLMFCLCIVTVEASRGRHRGPSVVLKHSP